jgi:hypothetical protein
MRTIPALIGAFCVVLLASGCKSKDRETPGAQAGRPVPPAAPATDRSAVLAELEGEGAGAPAAPAPLGQLVFAARGGAVAWISSVDGKQRVVHNGRPGAPWREVSSLVLSPDGRRFAYTGLGADGKWRIVVDGAERGFFDQVGTPVFSEDGAHVAYAVKDGAGWHLVVDEVTGRATASRYLAVEFAATAPRLAYVDAPEGEAEGRLVVADLSLEQQHVIAPRVAVLTTNADRTRIGALATAEGGQRVLTLPFDRPEEVTRGPEYEAVSGFDYGLQRVTVAYLAERRGARLIVLGDRDMPAPPEQVLGYPVVSGDDKAVGAVVAASGGRVEFREFFAQPETREGPWDEVEAITYGRGGRAHAYAARRGDRWFAVANGKEGPPFDRVVTPVFAPDGKTLVYRARQGGKRFVVVADASGKAVRQHPAYEQVFPVQFTADGKGVAYGVKDGRQVAWKVEPF